jgi:hypothetical protein
MRTRNWLKIKNPDYSQAEGRKELFDRWRGRVPAWRSCDVDFEPCSLWLATLVGCPATITPWNTNSFQMFRPAHYGDPDNP